MNNEAIAVKYSLHGPQIVRQRQSSSYARHPVSVKAVHSVGSCVSVIFSCVHVFVGCTQRRELCFRDIFMCSCVCACLCVCVYVCACVHSYVCVCCLRACVCACVCVVACLQELLESQYRMTKGLVGIPDD